MKTNKRTLHTVIIGVVIFAVMALLTWFLVWRIEDPEDMKPIAQFVKKIPGPSYFAIDLDDTFYVENKEVFRKNVEAFKFLKSRGVMPFFCTGRDPRLVRELLEDSFFEETGYKGFPGVYVNGALLYDEKGNVLKVSTFSPEFISKFHKFAIDNEMQAKSFYITLNGNYSVTEVTQKAADFLRGKKMIVPKVATIEEIKKMKVIAIILASKEFVIEGLRENVDYKVKYSYGFIAHLSPSDMTKQKGLELVLKHLGATGDDCAYIGDGDNDRECMKFCKISFAVGNASDDVKECAKWVVDLKHDEGAFAKVVNVMYGDE